MPCARAQPRATTWQHRTPQVVATGGLSFPVLGASDAGQRALGALGHTVAPLFPALTPLRGPHPGAQQLAGLSLYQVAMHCDRPQGRGQRRKVAAMRRGMVFTHRGFSGPAVLDLSHHLVCWSTLPH